MAINWEAFCGKRTLFPPKNCDVRMELCADLTFDLEARRWGKGFDGRREGAGEAQRKGAAWIAAQSGSGLADPN